MNKIFLLISITFLISILTSCSSDDSSSTSTAATTTTSGGAATVELSLSGVVTTLAGSTDNGSTNGTGTAASFYQPNLLTSDGTNAYVADYKNNMREECNEASIYFLFYRSITTFIICAG